MERFHISGASQHYRIENKMANARDNSFRLRHPPIRGARGDFRKDFTNIL